MLIKTRPEMNCITFVQLKLEKNFFLFFILAF